MRTYLGLLAIALRNAVRSKHELVLENLAVGRHYSSGRSSPKPVPAR